MQWQYAKLLVFFYMLGKKILRGNVLRRGNSLINLPIVVQLFVC